MNTILPLVYERVGCAQGRDLPSYTSFGCYTIVYYSKDYDAFCADCAMHSDTDETIVNADVYWEGPALECAHCGKDIESSYGDPDCEVKS